MARPHRPWWGRFAPGDAFPDPPPKEHVIRRPLKYLIALLTLTLVLSGCSLGWVANHHRAHGHTTGQDKRHQVEAYRWEAGVYKIFWRQVVEQARQEQLARGCAPGRPANCAALIRQEFGRRGLDGEAAVRVARCESGLNPRAYNPSSGASGLMQHLARYWPGRAARAGFPGASPFEPLPNVVAAAQMVRADGGWRQWECRP